jgi:hypothetical protein
MFVEEEGWCEGGRVNSKVKEQKSKFKNGVKYLKTRED